MPKLARTRTLVIALFILLVVAPLVAVAIISMFLFRPSGRVLEIEMRASGGTVAQLFWSSNFAMSGENSSTAPLHQHPGDFDRLRFSLPSMALEVLRFDPLDGPGEAMIRSMRVLDQEGHTVRTIDPTVMLPLYQIAQLAREPDGARVVTTPGANDPMLVMGSSWLTEPKGWARLQFVTPVSLAWIALASLALLGTAVGLVARDAFAHPFRPWQLLWLAALFLTVFWAKVALLHHYPAPVPFWDQWDGEGATLYVPYPQNGVTWRQMFTLHNEHRIFFTRVLGLTILALNGQWDPQLQNVVNAALHALIAVVFAAMLWMAWDRRHLPLIVVVVALAIGPPFALENTLAGFQSQFYFLVLFSILAVWLLSAHRLGTPSWWMGLFCAFCCPFTVAGGMLVAAPVALIAVLKAISEPGNWPRAAITVTAMAGVVALGYSALPPPIPYHQALKAGTIPDFVRALAHNVAFPWITHAAAAPLVWMPMGILVVGLLFRRLRSTLFEQICLGVALWVVVQGAAIAYSRGIGGAVPASRYLDSLSFGFVANGMALTTLFEQSRRIWKRILGAALAVWFVAGAWGIQRLSQELLATNARVRTQWSRAHIRNVQRFVLTNDVNAFLELRGPQDVPYHSPAMLAAWLRQPYIRQILPAVLRRPVELHPTDDSSDQTFSAVVSTGSGDQQIAFDSYARGGAPAEGRFESQPISCHEFRHLRFEVTGSSSWSGLRLSLKQLGSARETTVPLPASQSGWTGTSVRCPSGPFTVEAVDESPTGWLAFRQPSEVAFGSAIAESIIQRWQTFGIAALVLALLALGYTFSGFLLETDAPGAAQITRS